MYENGSEENIISTATLGPEKKIDIRLLIDSFGLNILNIWVNSDRVGTISSTAYLI